MESVIVCQNCREEHDCELFDEGLVAVFNETAEARGDEVRIRSVNQLDQPGGETLGEAGDHFDGDPRSFCSSCWLSLWEEAHKISERDHEEQDVA